MLVQYFVVSFSICQYFFVLLLDECAAARALPISGVPRRCFIQASAAVAAPDFRRRGSGSCRLAVLKCGFCMVKGSDLGTVSVPSERQVVMSKLMPAVVKSEPKAGVELREVPVPAIGRRRCPRQGEGRLHLRHRSAHLQLGPLGARTHRASAYSRPRVLWLCRRRRR